MTAKKKSVFVAQENDYTLSLKVDPKLWAAVESKQQRTIKKKLAGLDDEIYTLMQEMESESDTKKKA